MKCKPVTILALGVCIIIVGCQNQPRDTVHDSKEESVENILVKKGFPFLGELKQSDALKNVIREDGASNEIAAQQLKRVENALNECNDVSCLVSAIKWSDEEISEIGEQLALLYQQEEEFKDLVSVLREEGSYNLYRDSSDTDFVKEAWENSATGLNHVLNIYLGGEKPRYPNIDSTSYKVNHGRFIDLVENKLSELVHNQSEDELFFELPLQTALMALEINDRDEAARYEPLNEGMNQEPYDRIDDISWDSYEYSMILIPGQGPSERGIILDSLGIHKMELGLQRYKEGLAPYMVVSGGHVHPYKTPFCEAVEMKKYMMEKFDIPDDTIFIEPHARHTTTNLRNISRMIYRFGIPADKTVLIVTDSGQNRYINGRMGDRGFNELGYYPFKELVQLGENESYFLPVETSLQADPFDILDP